MARSGQAPARNDRDKNISEWLILKFGLLGCMEGGLETRPYGYLNRDLMLCKTGFQGFLTAFGMTSELGICDALQRLSRA